MENDIYQLFKDQLGRNEERWHKTNIMWKQFSQGLPSNKTGGLGGLKSLLRKMRKDPKKSQQYDQIISDQLKNHIVICQRVLFTPPTCDLRSCRKHQSKN